MRIKFIKSFIKNNLKFYLSLVICSAICFATFVTFNHVKVAVETGLNTYLDDYSYYDGLIQPYFGTFTNEEVKSVENIPDIWKVQKAYIMDSIISNDKMFRYIRLIGVDLSNYDFYVVDEVKNGDILLSAEFAHLNKIKAGDSVTVKINNQDVSLKVRQIINTPEIMGASRGVSYSLEQSSLGFAYVDIAFLAKYTNVSEYNTLTYYLRSNASDVAVKVNNIFKDRQIYYEESDSLVAKNNIKNDMEVLSPIATILPILIYVIGLVISVLFIRQFIEIKLKDIGVLKANGLSNLYIISIFMGYVLSIFLGGTILGIILAIIQSRIYTNFYTNSLFLPRFTIINNYKVILIAIICSLVTSLVSVLFNIKKIVKVDVLNIINENVVTKYKKIKFLRNKLILVKSFISSIFNKPSRFIFSVINMTFVVIIVTASLGVKAAKDTSISYVYDKTVNYDYIIHYHSYASIPDNGDNSFRELIVTLNDNYYERLVALNNTNYINIYDMNDKMIDIGEGIILSSKAASDLNVKIGDYVYINNYRLKIVNISKQVTEFKSYISIDTYKSIFKDDTCNAYFVRENINDYDIDSDDVYYISNTKLLKKDIINKFSYISNYIIIIVVVSSLLSIIVIFNMSVIYYKERYREHRILRTIGYSYVKIIAFSIIEIIIQGIISLTVGIPLGYLCTNYVISKINNDYIVLYSSFKNIPIGYIVFFIMGVAILGRILASYKQIKLVDD